MIISLLFLCGCSNHNSGFAEKSFFNKSLYLLTPNNWHPLPTSGIWNNAVRDSTQILYMGSLKRNYLTIKVTKQYHVGVYEIANEIASNIYHSNHNSSKITYFYADSVNNMITVDYLGRNDTTNKIYYFRDLLAIKNRKWISLKFNGPNNKAFRDTVGIVSNSFKAN